MTTTTKRRVTALECLNWRLDAARKEAREEREKIAARILEGNTQAEYELRWLEGLYRKVEVAKYAEMIEITMTKAIQEGRGSVVPAQELRESFKANLNRWHPEHSSSPFHNACNDERYGALREIVEILTRYLEDEGIPTR